MARFARFRKNKRKILASLVVACAASWAMSIFAMEFQQHHRITGNLTFSRPEPWWVLLYTNQVKKGDFVFFQATNNGYWNRPFGKEIAGAQGDVVTQVDRVFYVNGKRIGKAKERSARFGTDMSLGPTGVIPENKYFVYTEHEDSLDSRYANVGWVDRKDIIGKLKPGVECMSCHFGADSHKGSS